VARNKQQNESQKNVGQSWQPLSCNIFNIFLLKITRRSGYTDNSRTGQRYSAELNGQVTS